VIGMLVALSVKQTVGVQKRQAKVKQTVVGSKTSSKSQANSWVFKNVKSTVGGSITCQDRNVWNF